MRKRVVIAGATGFVGRYLIDALVEEYDVIALSRSISSEGHIHAGVEWRRCDLFSLLDAEHGVEGADIACYLVHSMMPSARLTQGHFSDLDLIAADNFARAARDAGVKQIIYLGGIVPSAPKLSMHLRSRWEVEQTLAAYDVPVTSLRAGLVIGREGSSFQILQRLAQRLPLMACPSWTASACHPIAIQDVIALILFCLGNADCYGETYDVGGPDEISYRGLIELTASLLGRRPRTLHIPLFSPRLSTLWVSLVTGTSQALVGPLVQSLKHDMLVQERRLQEQANIPGMPIKEALQKAIDATPWEGIAAHFRPGKERTQPSSGTSTTRTKPRPAPSPSDVRSVQRLPLPPERDAAFVAQEYMRWLPSLLPFVLRVDVDDEQRCSFCIRGLPWPVLVLQLSHERSQPDRQLFYITGGLLAAETIRGRLEFRESLGGECVLAGIHDFKPKLPWFVYISTQAIVHGWVMAMFGRHLGKIASQTSEPAGTAP